MPDAEWGGPPGHKDAMPEPPQAAGWEWELDANGVPVQRLEEVAATLGGVSDRELRERARFLVQSPGFVPRGPDRSVVTAFVMLADVEAGSVRTAPGGGGKGPWVRVTLP